jgi:hypothetical protein
MIKLVRRRTMAKEEETTVKCGNCGRTIYKSEICICKQDPQDWNNVPTGDKFPFIKQPVKR